MGTWNWRPKNRGGRLHRQAVGSPKRGGGHLHGDGRSLERIRYLYTTHTFGLIRPSMSWYTLMQSLCLHLTLFDFSQPSGWVTYGRTPLQEHLSHFFIMGPPTYVIPDKLFRLLHMALRKPWITFTSSVGGFSCTELKWENYSITITCKKLVRLFI